MHAGAYLPRRKPDEDTAFGLWKGHVQEGLSYQDALRDEWDAPTVHEPHKP
ncbi:MAG: hypothetical protein Q9M24_06825 [Mariprofundaceae bacterium]|nr:hypothetical protein [Mariprofundaceae bacterium]